MSSRSSSRLSQKESASTQPDEEEDDEQQHNNSSSSGSRGGGGGGGDVSGRGNKRRQSAGEEVTRDANERSSGSSSGSYRCPFKRHASDSNHLEAQYDLAMLKMIREDSAKVDAEWLTKENKFNALSQEARIACIGTVARVFLSKGAQKQKIDRSLLLQELKDAGNPEYAKHLDVALQKAKVDLYDIFGYIIVQDDRLLGNMKLDASNKDNETKKQYFLKNGLQNNALRGANHVKYLQFSDAEYAYRGFLFAVCHAIFSSVGREITFPSLVGLLKRFDPSITLEANSKKTLKADSSSSNGGKNFVQSLYGDPTDLLIRMKDENYIVQLKETQKDSAGNATNAEDKLQLGPRFYTDIGLYNTLQSHFDMRKEVVPASIEKSFDEESVTFLARFPPEVRDNAERQLNLSSNNANNDS